MEAEHGWVLDVAAPSTQRSARLLAEEGLVETAGRETRAELSAWEGRPVRWAVRLTAAGHDLLAYAGVLPAPTPCAPGPGQQLVELAPSQMAALRLFVGLADQLKSPPAGACRAGPYFVALSPRRRRVARAPANSSTSPVAASFSLGTNILELPVRQTAANASHSIPSPPPASDGKTSCAV
ncbi:hypothetical protein [Streptomyces sp. NPDC058295]|uniref:hypothetical protein n=1 Tax=Streptomyces sp. NPDC058295 TaxID=3346431 RepID=UPI0036E89442